MSSLQPWPNWSCDQFSPTILHFRGGYGGTDSKYQISIGEIEIIKDDHQPRGLWKLGIVQELMKGRDGQTIKSSCSQSHLSWSTTYDIEKTCIIAVPTRDSLWVNWDDPSLNISWSWTQWALTWQWHCDWAGPSEKSHCWESWSSKGVDCRTRKGQF